MKKTFLFIPAGLLLAGAALAETVDFTLLQLNDIYEITPVAGGNVGGLARVATLRQQLLQENPKTYTILAGDFLSPSALGTAKLDGERLAGRQMVDVLNTMGLDYATFGNHEFDIAAEALTKRLAEARFQWLSGNITAADGQPLPGVPPLALLTLKGAEGAVVRVALLGLTTPHGGYPETVRVADPLATAQAQVATLDAEVVIAVTHLDLAADQQLAEGVPEIDLILGGHEHENIQQWRGADFTPIFKADANARTVYIHRLRYDTETKQLTIKSQLQPVTDAIPLDRATDQVVQQWLGKAFAGFRTAGFAPEEVVAVTDQALDGLEASVRNRATLLTELIAQSMLAATGAELALYNSGSIRIDDVLPPGVLTQYDVIRILPFGGQLLTVELAGTLLQQVLQQGEANRGKGGYLQTARVTATANGYLIDGAPLAPTRRYRVAINDFLLSGRERGLEFLTQDHPDVRVLAQGQDVRFALITEIERRWPQQ